MDPFVNSSELDTYLKERIGALPKELASAVENDALFKSVADLLAAYNANKDTIEDVKYEVFLILTRITPLEELPQTLISDYGFELKAAMEITQKLKEGVLKAFMPFLINLTDDEIAEKPPLPAAQTPNLKERLHLRPEGVPNQPGAKEESMAKPLTREELMGSLLAKRTMASDIAAVKGAVSPPHQHVQPSTPEKKEPPPQNLNNPQK